MKPLSVAPTKACLLCMSATMPSLPCVRRLKRLCAGWPAESARARALSVCGTVSGEMTMLSCVMWRWLAAEAAATSVAAATSIEEGGRMLSEGGRDNYNNYNEEKNQLFVGQDSVGLGSGRLTLREGEVEER